MEFYLHVERHRESYAISKSSIYSFTFLLILVMFIIHEIYVESPSSRTFKISLNRLSMFKLLMNYIRFIAILSTLIHFILILINSIHMSFKLCYKSNYTYFRVNNYIKFEFRVLFFFFPLTFGLSN